MMNVSLNVKLDYFYRSAFDLEVKATEILKYILLFSVEKNGQVRGTNYQVLGKGLNPKTVLSSAIEK